MRLQMQNIGLIGLSGYAGSGKDEVAKILFEYGGYKKKAFADKLRFIANYLDVFMPEINMTYNQWLEKWGGYEQAKRQHPCIRKHLVRLGHGARETLWRSIWIDNVLPDPNGAVRLLRQPGCKLKLNADTIRNFAMFVDGHCPHTSQSYSTIYKIHVEKEEEGKETPLPAALWCEEYLKKIENVILMLIHGFHTEEGVEDMISNNPHRKMVISDVRYKNESYRIRKEYAGEVWMIVRPGVGPANQTEADSIASVKYDLIIHNDGTLHDLRAKVYLHLLVRGG